ncbi:MAG: ExeM/NucH family extracellular endonuclease [Planctomycetota bacterium]
MIPCWTTFLLFTSAGCQPESDRNTDTTSESDTADDTPGFNATDVVVLSGALETVNWGDLVGSNVKIEGDLVVVDTFDLVRRGQIRLARQRLVIPTSLIDPNDADPDGQNFEGGNNVAKVIAAEKSNRSAAVIVDDGTMKENIFPPKLLPGLGTDYPTLRVGSIVSEVTGTVDMVDGKPVLVPSEALRITPASRPSCPKFDSGHTTVASFNVLNYFTTIDNGRNNARGADSPSELKRQEAKLVAAMVEMDADVIGLMELENNLAAEERLVKALNQAIGKDVYVGCGRPDAFEDAPGGSDSIRVGIIYRTDRVESIGEPKLIRDPAFYRARTPIAQTFQKLGGGKPFTVVVNHFKSKGGGNDADDANKDKGDGQAAYNAVRRTQSLAICRFIESTKSSQDTDRILVLGDLNAYQQEDPIDALRANGLIDLHEQNGVPSRDGVPEYSFVYYGQCGSLDHAFATPSLAADISGVATWHINADEPRFVDYNEEFNPPALFEANPYRSSDHDPVLIGIGD